MSADRLRTGTDGVTRCWWCGDDPLYVRYHDDEWGHEVVDDVRLFEKLILEGFQSGLAWITILRKRENFRRRVRRLRRGHDRGLRPRRRGPTAGRCRHRAPSRQDREHDQQRRTRCSSWSRSSARCTRYVQQFRPPPTNLTATSELRATCPESIAMSKDLKKRGWSFVGPTTMYAFMQAMGLVNDHIAGCERQP